MKTIFKLKHILRIVLAAGLLLIGFILYVYLSSGDCLEHGGVWDYKQMKCRKDCITWNWRYGCVPIPDDDKLEDYLYGYCVGKENELNICKAVRLELERRKLSNGTLERDAKK